MGCIFLVRLLAFPKRKLTFGLHQIRISKLIILIKIKKSCGMKTWDFQNIVPFWRSWKSVLIAIGIRRAVL